MIMKSFSEKLTDFLFKRQYAFCFCFNVASGKVEYKSNFQIEKIFSGEFSNPIEAMLNSSSLSDSDKSELALFYAGFKKACSIPCPEQYIDKRIQISLDGKMVPLSVSIGWICGSDGLASEIIGYAVSTAHSEFSISYAEEQTNAKAPFPVETVMKRMMTTKENFAIVQFDITRFKIINESYGDITGDAVLENIRCNLDRVWGREAVTCRLGADIFAIFSEYSDINELEERIQYVKDELQHYNDINYTFTFGVYLVKDKSVPLRKMSDFAAMARRNIKSKAVQTIEYFNDKLNDELHNRHEIEAEMQSALDSGQFKVYLQPKCRTSDGVVVGAEALVRWIHPQKGVIPPDRFIPVFETDGFIEQLDTYVHTEVCKLLRKWLDLGIDYMPISVNVSRVYLGKPNLAELIRRKVDEYGIPVELFQLEITETYDDSASDRVIAALKEKGFILLMDDFGSGYSSLNTLKNTQFDVIKLDKEFFGNSMMSERGQKIITHTIAMTNDINLEIMAEGVETSEQAVFLDGSGCKYAQGYFYSRPVPVEEFERTVFRAKVS